MRSPPNSEVASVSMRTRKAGGAHSSSARTASAENSLLTDSNASRGAAASYTERKLQPFLRKFACDASEQSALSSVPDINDSRCAAMFCSQNWPPPFLTKLARFARDLSALSSVLTDTNASRCAKAFRRPNSKQRKEGETQKRQDRCDLPHPGRSRSVCLMQRSKEKESSSQKERCRPRHDEKQDSFRRTFLGKQMVGRLRACLGARADWRPTFSFPTVFLTHTDREREREERDRKQQSWKQN